MSRSRYSVRAGTAMAAILAVLFAAGCGSDESVSQAAETTGTDLTGPVVKVMTFAPQDNQMTVMPGIPAVAKAAAAQINANGGINGGRLEVITCNEQANPAGAQACAEQAVREGVAAVVGSNSTNGEAFYPILEGAGIPVIGVLGPNPKDLTSPMSFPISATIASQMIGAGVMAGQNGCEKLGVVALDVPAAMQSAQFLNQGFKATGATNDVVITSVPVASTDFAPIVAASTRGDTDCIAFAMSIPLINQYMTAFADTNATQKFVGFGGGITGKNITSSGGADGPAEGALVVAEYPIDSDPVWDAYHDALSKYIPNQDELVSKGANFAGIPEHNTWAAYQAFADVTQGLTTVDKASVVAALNSNSAVDTGVSPPLNYTEPFQNPKTPRLFSRQLRFETVKDGKIVPLDTEWHDMTPAFLGQPMPS